MSPFSAPGSILIKTTLLHCGGIVVSTQTLLLSKQAQTVVTGRQRDAQTIEFLGAYTLLGKPAVI